MNQAYLESLVEFFLILEFAKRRTLLFPLVSTADGDPLIGNVNSSRVRGRRVASGVARERDRRASTRFVLILQRS